MTHNYSVAHKPSLKIIGIECRTSNALTDAPIDIPRHWQKLFDEEILSRIPNKMSSEFVALYCDYASDHTGPYSFVMGSQVSSLDDIPSGMVAKILPATSYAVFHVTGEYPSSIINTWNAIWNSDIKRTFTGDFQVYPATFNQDKAKELDLFLAIQ